MNRNQICKFYARGQCRNGNNCRYSHTGPQNNQFQIQGGSQNNNRNQNNQGPNNNFQNNQRTGNNRNQNNQRSNNNAQNNNQWTNNNRNQNNQRPNNNRQNNQGDNNSRQRNQNDRNQNRDSNFRPSGGFPAGQGQNSVETDMMQASLLVWRFSSYGPGTGCANVIVGHDLSEEEVRCKLYELRLTRPNDWQMCFSSFIESMKQQMEVQLEHVRNNSERFVPRTSNQPSSAFGSQAQPFAPTQHAVGGSSQVPFPQPAAPLGFPSQPNTVPQGFPTQPNPAPPPVVSQQNFPTQNPPLPTAANPPPSMAESTFYNLEINHEYTPNEWEAFQADNFTLGGIPEYPPPPEVQR